MKIMNLFLLLIAPASVILGVSTPSAARISPAFTGIDRTGNFRTSDCGYYGDNGSVYFRASSTCAAGSLVTWDFPVRMESSESVARTMPKLRMLLRNATADGVTCRGIAVGYSTGWTAPTSLSFGLWTVDFDNRVNVSPRGAASVQCQIRIPSGTPVEFLELDYDPTAADATGERTMMANGGVGFEDFATTGCGQFLDYNLSIGSSAACPVGTTYTWYEPLLMDGSGSKRVRITGITYAETITATCRPMSENENGTAVWVTPRKSVTTGSFTLDWTAAGEVLQVPTNGRAWTECEISVPSSDNPLYFTTVRHKY